MLSKNNGDVVNRAVVLAAKRFRREIEKELEFILRALILEDGTMQAYRFLGKTYARLARRAVVGAVDEPRGKALETKERSLAERIGEGPAKVILRLLKTGHYSQEMFKPITEMLPKMLREAADRTEAKDHQHIVQKLKKLAATHPYLAAEMLRDYFHLRVQEGKRDGADQEFGDIFLDTDDSYIFANWKLMDILSREVAKQDNSHDTLRALIGEIITRDSSRIYKVAIIGSGSGRLARELARAYPKRLEILETDIGAAQIVRSFQENVRRNLHSTIKGVPQDSGKLCNFADESVDIVISFGALRYYWDNRLKSSVNELKRIIRKDGVAIVGDVQQRHNWPYMIPAYEKELRDQGFATNVHREINTVSRNTTLYNLNRQYIANQERDYNRIFRMVIDEIARRDSDAHYLSTLVALAGTKEGHIRLIAAANDENTLKVLRDADRTAKGVVETKVNQTLSKIVEGKDRAYRKRIESAMPALKEVTLAVRSVKNKAVENLLGLIESVSEYDAVHNKSFVETISDLLAKAIKEIGAEKVWLLLEWDEGEILNSEMENILREPERAFWTFAFAQSIAYKENHLFEASSIEEAFRFLKDAPVLWDRLETQAELWRLVKVWKLLGYITERPDLYNSFRAIYQSLTKGPSIDINKVRQDLVALEKEVVTILRELPIKVAELGEIGYEDKDDNWVVQQLLTLNKLIKDTLWGGVVETNAIREQKRKGRDVFVAYLELEGRKIIVGQTALKLKNNIGFGRLFASLDCFQRGFGIGKALAKRAILKTKEAGYSAYYVAIRETNTASLAFFRDLAHKLENIKDVREVKLPNLWGDTDEEVVEITYKLTQPQDPKSTEEEKSLLSAKEIKEELSNLCSGTLDKDKKAKLFDLAVAIDRADEVAIEELPFDEISTVFAAYLSSHGFVDEAVLKLAVLEHIQGKEYQKKLFFFIKTLLTLDRFGFDVSKIDIVDSLGEREERANVVILGQVERYTIPYLLAGKEHELINVFAAVDTSWVSFRENNVYLDRGILFTREGIRLIAAKDKVKIHYVFNKTKKLDAALKQAGVPVSGESKFEEIAQDKIITTAALQRAGVNIPRGLMFIGKEKFKQLSANQQTLLFYAGKRLVFWDETCSEDTISEQLEALKVEGEIVVKPAHGQKGEKVEFFSMKDGKAAAARAISSLLRTGEGVVVEERIIPAFKGDWNLRAFVSDYSSGQDLAGIDLIVDRKNRVFVIEANGNGSGGVDRLWSWSEKEVANFVVASMASRAITYKELGQDALTKGELSVKGMYVREKPTLDDKPVNVSQGANFISWTGFSKQFGWQEKDKITDRIKLEATRAFNAIVQAYSFGEEKEVYGSVSRGLSFSDYSNLYWNVLIPARNEGRLREPEHRIHELVQRVIAFYEGRDEPETAKMIKETEFMVVTPKPDAPLDESSYYIWYESAERFLLAQSLRIGEGENGKGDEGRIVVCLPYLLITTLILQDAPLSTIAKLIKHEADHANEIRTTGHTDEISEAHNEQAIEILSELEEYLIFKSDEESLGPLYAQKLITQPRVKGRISSVDKGEIPILKNIPAQDRERYIKVAIEALEKGEVAGEILCGGSGARMNLSDPPATLDLLMQSQDIPGLEVNTTTGRKQIPKNCKGIVPLLSIAGKWLNFITLHLTNHLRLLQRLGLKKEHFPLVYGTGASNHKPQWQLLTSEGFDQSLDVMHYWQHPEYKTNPGKRVVPTVSDVDNNRSTINKFFTDVSSGDLDRQKADECFQRSIELASTRSGEVISVRSHKDRKSYVINAPRGHGGNLHNFFAAGLVLDLIRKTPERPEGVKYLFFRNVDNSAARYDEDWLVILGMCIANKNGALLEVSRRPIGQKGGTLIKILDERGNIIRKQIAEDDALKDTKVRSTEAYYINNAVGIFSLEEFLFKIYGTTYDELRVIEGLPNMQEKLKRLGIIADRGFKKFPIHPVIRVVRDCNGEPVLGVVFETNMWESTGATVGDLNIDAIEVDSIEDLRDEIKRSVNVDVSAELTDEQLKKILIAELGANGKAFINRVIRWIRFAPTKDWVDYLGINEVLLAQHLAPLLTAKDLVPSLGTEEAEEPEKEIIVPSEPVIALAKDTILPQIKAMVKEMNPEINDAFTEEIMRSHSHPSVRAIRQDVRIERMAKQVVIHWSLQRAYQEQQKNLVCVFNPYSIDARKKYPVLDFTEVVLVRSKSEAAKLVRDSEEAPSLARLFIQDTGGYVVESWHYETGNAIFCVFEVERERAGGGSFDPSELIKVYSCSSENKVYAVEGVGPGIYSIALWHRRYTQKEILDKPDKAIEAIMVGLEEDGYIDFDEMDDFLKLVVERVTTEHIQQHLKSQAREIKDFSWTLKRLQIQSLLVYRLLQYYIRISKTAERGEKGKVCILVYEPYIGLLPEIEEKDITATNSDINEMLVVLPHTPQYASTRALTKIDRALEICGGYFTEHWYASFDIAKEKERTRVIDVVSYEINRVPDNPLPEDAAQGTRRLVNEEVKRLLEVLPQIKAKGFSIHLVTPREILNPEGLPNYPDYSSHLSHGVTHQDANPIKETIDLIFAQERAREPDAQMKAMLNQAKDSLKADGQDNLARLIEESEFRFTIPSSDIRNNSPPQYIWYKSDEKFVLATTVEHKNTKYALIPYHLITYLISHNAPISLIARIFAHEAKHIHSIFASEAQHDQEAQEIISEIQNILKVQRPVIALDEVGRTAFLIIKPDGSKYKDEILKDIQDARFEFVSVITRPNGMPREVAEQFYAEHKGKPFFEALIAYIGSGETTCVIVRGPDEAYKKLRKLVGATKGDEAGTLRHKYGREVGVFNCMVDGQAKEIKVWMNKIHVSDSQEAVRREIAITHSENELEQIFPKKNYAGTAICVTGGVAGGKSTTANAIAKRLGAFRVSVGWVYRALLYISWKIDIDFNALEDQSKLVEEAKNIVIVTKNNQPRILYKGKDITNDIEKKAVEIERISLNITQEVHKLSTSIWTKAVHEYLSRGENVVIDLTARAAKVIYGNVLLVHLDAPARVRAERRADDFISNMGLESAYKKLVSESDDYHALLKDKKQEGVRRAIVDVTEEDILAREAKVRPADFPQDLRKIDSLDFDNAILSVDEIAEQVVNQFKRTRELALEYTLKLESLVEKLLSAPLSLELRPDLKDELFSVLPLQYALSELKQRPYLL